MTKQSDSPHTPEQLEVMPLAPHEHRAWDRVQRVREQYAKPEISTVVEACEAAGVPRQTHYADLRLPYVQGMVLQEQAAMHELTLAMITRNWYRTVKSMVTIASDPSNRNAVGAFRALGDERDKAVEALGVEEEVATGTLDDLMQSFAAMPAARKKVSATKKVKGGTVTVELDGMLSES